jgi:hypothetical protein
VAHFKRSGPKNSRSGCLMCKPHKANGVGREADPIAVRRAIQDDEDRPVPNALPDNAICPHNIKDPDSTSRDCFFCIFGEGFRERAA